MANKILILEDTAARVGEMRIVMRELLSEYEPVVFDNVPDLLQWMEEHLAEVSLICLDHDLGPTRSRDGQAFDPGIGRDVVDVLGMRAPVCPVIVHSSNSIAVPGMLRVLREAGWRCSAVMPSDDLRWINTDWRSEINWYLRNGWIFR
jgi:hypothetical protein